VFARRHTLTFQNLDFKNDNPIFQQFLYNESLDINNYVCNYISTSTKYCLGSLIFSRLNKLTQLKCAASVGFEIPDTKIVNNIHHPMFDYNCITKPVSDVFVESFDDNCYYSGGVVNTRSNMLNRDFAFPSLIQKEIKKELEIRVFFFENNFFSIARMPKIGKYCTKVDWRDYNQDYDSMRFFPIDLDLSIKNKLMDLSKLLNINTGSFDLIFSKGKYYFLEVNPHGQFGFVGSIGNFNIEKQIAVHLINKMKGNL